MANYIFKVLHENDYYLWDRLLKESQSPSPFLNSSWFMTYAAASGEKYQLIGCYEKEELVAGFGFFYRRKLGKFNVIINLLGVDNYIFYKPRESNFESKKESWYFSIYESFISFLEKDFHHIELTFNTGSQDVRPFQWNKYSEQIRYTYVGEIQPPDDMMKCFNPDVRNKIKKAHKLDFRFDISGSSSEIEISYDLIDRSLKKNSQPHILGKKQFKLFCQNLIKVNSLIVANIYLEDEPIATRVIVHNDKLAIDFQAGGNEEMFNTGLNQLLSLKIFEELHAKGIEMYDFRGANTPSVARYKSSFNMKAQPYYVLSKDKGFLLKTLLFVKNRFL
ncbi:GNAT family N-acetyltransferase [Carboxylicivirga caseinilyticus]|uniref:GNAT family N-acetyltransferase n=1 Tax=Carboxylicivirga caseinilyticus TaxID=3417572 RepID=UPI003D3408A8|nr:GNAT family N-acetyltransferase [Marinilabiliaceae bacterium A049]